MTGVTNRSFRQLYRQLGAGLAISEMVASNPELWSSKKTKKRIDLQGEESPRVVQIAGADPEIMAQAHNLMWIMGPRLLTLIRDARPKKFAIPRLAPPCFRMKNWLKKY